MTACELCDHLHTAADTIAVDRFLIGGPNYRAQYVNSPIRATRARAERDMCEFRRTLHPEPEQGGLFE